MKAQIDVGPRPLSSHARCTVTASGLTSATARPVILGRFAVIVEAVLFVGRLDLGSVWGVCAPPANNTHTPVKTGAGAGAHHDRLGASRCLGANAPTVSVTAGVLLGRELPYKQQSTDTIRTTARSSERQSNDNFQVPGIASSKKSAARMALF